MQVLLNCHLAAFLEFEWTVQKSNLITLACVIALVHFSYLHNCNMGKTIYLATT